MRGAALTALAAVVLIGLPAAPAEARVDPVVPFDPFAEPHPSCVVPAVSGLGTPCGPLRSPKADRATACTLPVVYLGGRPGPCPRQEEPPESRIVPLAPSDLSR